MKTLNKIMAVFFGAIGLVALAGAVFFKAPYHFITVAICAGMVAINIYDNKKQN